MYDYALVAIGSGGSENTTDMVRETSFYGSPKKERTHTEVKNRCNDE